MDSDRDYHFNKRTDKTYVSKRLPWIAGRSFRIASKVMDGEVGQHFATELNEVVIRRTVSGRQEVIAKFFEDDRRIFTLTFQRWLTDIGRPFKGVSFSFGAREIETLLEFLFNIKRMHFPSSEKVNITDEELRRLILSDDQGRRLLMDNEELIATLVENEVTSRDIRGLGYRRKQLKEFERLLSDPATAEGDWQAFFEANKWIFGYGLSYVSFSGLDQRKLELVVAGANFTTAGKIADAVMKTRSLVNSLGFVEIKTHMTDLVSEETYRSGTWQPSKELTGGIAQAQATVFQASKALGAHIRISNRDGTPTGEEVFNIEPRSFLVAGSLDQFETQNGINEVKCRCFEMFRRSVRSPEIITFDELFHRAKFIVEHDANDVPSS
jgi:hypothetical protein